ncbi:MAG: hypothetical protein WB622_09770, partial [Acidobacteriaceae bacterium]
ILRELVGGWIDSGFRSGRENPSARHYTTPEGESIFVTVASMLNCHLGIRGSERPSTSAPGGPPNRIAPGKRPLPGPDDDPRYKPPAPAETASTDVFVLTANPTWKGEDGSPVRGALAIQLNPSGGIEFTPAFFGDRLTPSELAAWVFLHFWTSGWIFSLMRCNKCRDFFFPVKRWRAGHSYDSGWHCPAHRKSAGAAKRVGRVRKSERNRRRELMVSFYKEFHSHPRRSTNDLVSFVVQRMSEHGIFLSHQSVARQLRKISNAAAPPKPTAQRSS